MGLPVFGEIPTRDSDARAFQAFAQKYNPAEIFRLPWGDQLSERADALDRELTRQFAAGRSHPDGSAEEALFCFCRMWICAPYLGASSLEDLLSNRRALWLLDGIRRHVAS